MKKLIVCLCVGLVLACCSAGFAAQYGDFTYTTNNNEVTITDYTGSGGDVIITNMIDGLPVTTIGNQAFKNESLTSITMPDSVTTIGDEAFDSCGGLTSITMPDSVTTIGDWAFASCGGLTSIIIPDSVITIGDLAFVDCIALTSVTIGSSVTNIGADAFRYCSALTSITIPDSVTTIGDRAFDSCSGLSAITVDTNNPAYSSVAGVLFDKSQEALIQYPGSIVGSYMIPVSVITIENHAFAFCSGLTGITIPDSVITIGNGAFLDCIALTSITIPDSVTTIGSSAFGSCSGLTSITMPDSVITIGDLAFIECIALTSITISDSVTTIGDLAFSSCSGLTSVYCPGNAPSVGMVIFLGADDVTVYYSAGTSGWGATFGDRPTVLWNPLIQTDDGSFGMQVGEFGFNIAESESGLVVVEACENLSNGIWVPLQTNSMTSNTIYFSDPGYTNYSVRFYQLDMP